MLLFIENEYDTNARYCVEFNLLDALQKMLDGELLSKSNLQDFVWEIKDEDYLDIV